MWDDAYDQDEYTGRHRVPTTDVGFPEAMWSHPDVRESASAFWDGVTDWAEDGELSEAARERMIRAGRTLIQGVLSAVAVGVAPLAWDLLKGNADVSSTGALSALGTAALASVVAYFHKRKS